MPGSSAHASSDSRRSRNPANAAARSQPRHVGRALEIPLSAISTAASGILQPQTRCEPSIPRSTSKVLQIAIVDSDQVPRRGPASFAIELRLVMDLHQRHQPSQPEPPSPSVVVESSQGRVVERRDDQQDRRPRRALQRFGRSAASLDREVLRGRSGRSDTASRTRPRARRGCRRRRSRSVNTESADRARASGIVPGDGAPDRSLARISEPCLGERHLDLGHDHRAARAREPGEQRMAVAKAIGGTSGACLRFEARASAGLSSPSGLGHFDPLASQDVVRGWSCYRPRHRSCFRRLALQSASSLEPSPRRSSTACRAADSRPALDGSGRSQTDERRPRRRRSAGLMSRLRSRFSPDEDRAS